MKNLITLMAAALMTALSFAKPPRTVTLNTRVIVTYALKDGAAFGHTIIWWNGLFGFGAGFCVTWAYYLSGRWKRRIK